MIIKIIMFITVVMTPNIVSSQDMNAWAALVAYKDHADHLYDQKKYGRAFAMYIKLSEFNDKYSQYKIATMYENGLFVDPDPIAAYAWSNIAAEIEIPDFIKYNIKIKQSLSEEQLNAAKSLAVELKDKYGIFSYAVKTKKYLRERERHCGGGTPARCDRVAVTSPFCGAAGISSSYKIVSDDCLRIGSLGLMSVAGTMPVVLRDLDTTLDVVIRTYNPGHVELGDLEFIDDESEIDRSDTSRGDTSGTYDEFELIEDESIKDGSETEHGDSSDEDDENRF